MRSGIFALSLFLTSFGTLTADDEKKQDTTTGRTLRPQLVFKITREGVSSIALSPKGDRLAVDAPYRSKKNSCLIYDVATQKPILEIPHGDANVAISEKWSFAASKKNRTISIWDLHQGRKVFNFTTDVEGSSVLAISRDGRRVVVHRNARGEQPLEVWELDKNGNARRKGKTTRNIHWSPVIAFSPDGKTFSCGFEEMQKGDSETKTLRVGLYNAENAERIKEIILPGRMPAYPKEQYDFSPDSRKMAFTVALLESFYVIDLESGKHTRISARLRGGMPKVRWSRSGRFLTSFSAGRATLWKIDEKTGQLEKMRTYKKRPDADFDEEFIPFAFSSDARVVAVGSGKKRQQRMTLQLLNARSGEKIVEFSSIQGVRVRFSQDGRFLCVDNGENVEVWRIEEAKGKK